MFSSPPLERPVSAPSCLVGLPPRLIHKNVTRNDEANNDWDLWKREGKSPSEVQNKWLKNVHKCLRSLPCLSIPASPSSANWATSTEMQFPHSHQGLFNFFTPEVGQSVRFWFLPSSACFRGDGWHDHGCGHGRGRQLGHQDNNSMHRRNWTRVMDDPCKTFWNTLEMFSHFLSWERDKSAWHNPSMGHRTGTSHRTNTSRGTGVIGERGEKYFPMGERLHSSNSQREIELQLSEKANLILPLIKT